MAAPVIDNLNSAKKRKRKGESIGRLKKKSKATLDVHQDATVQNEILQLEEKILNSRTNYNEISTLIKLLRPTDSARQTDVVAAVGLCRVFCKLMAVGSLSKPRESSGNEAIIVRWLRERLQDYEEALLAMLRHEDVGKQSTALTLLLRLAKVRAAHLDKSEDDMWRDGVFKKILKLLVVDDEIAEETRKEFLEKYVEGYDDIRYYTFGHLADLVLSGVSEASLRRLLSILAAIEMIPQQQEEFEYFYIGPPSKAKHDLYSLTAHKKQAQKAWTTVLRQHLDKSLRKTILGVMSQRIAPWFLKVELLMDFLTDSINIGGSTSLMALSGLFYLIQEKNLDYPQFYHKLYSLLDANILHSKHRSSFFRLLETFLASTHLPAALVASFIKRLARLSLFAPPSGIVVVVPWIYNLLKHHPACTFMIHRNGDIDCEGGGWGDPFRMEELDPMETDALESSLWEIQMLQSHYHPNVATIAKIISEQFTKQAYNLEDFLDHSYGSILDAELSKDIKKAPEIEFNIPKKIFMQHDSASGEDDSLPVKLWDFP